MLDKIKKSMRISHDKLDDSITDDIEICKKELEMAGVYCKDTDPLLQKACELYAKWQNDYGGKGERYEKAYNKLKDAMALYGDYIVQRDSNVNN